MNYKLGASSNRRRLRGWDYAKGASFFITISTEPRRQLFGKIVGGKMRLSKLGEETKATLERMPMYSPEISLFGNVVMPDHVHFNVHLAAGLDEPLKRLGQAIRSFKNHTTKVWKALYAREHGSRASTGNGDFGAHVGSFDSEGSRTKFANLLWQQGYHDWLCLSRGFIDSTERYIAYNPLKWELMYGSDKRLYINEPLSSSRLDAADYWKGVGNLALLDPDTPMVSLRVSRRVRDIPAVVARMENAVDKGYTIISGFISPGERAVLDMLRARKDARFIRMRPSCIPNARFKPESAYVEAFMEERYLEIGRGNDEAEFCRAACLDLNDEIIQIAIAGEGLALYFQPDGLYRFGNDAKWRMTR